MKERLDVLLVNRGLAASREKAKAVIMAGEVYVDGQKEDKAGSMFDAETSVIEVRGNTLPYVSRGGLKLAKAIEVFPIDLTDKICMDIGASTGGFTDCMLQNGAAKVYAIDVGHGQLDWKLRNDPRVICMEKTNFRYLEPEALASAETEKTGKTDANGTVPVAEDVAVDAGGVAADVSIGFAGCDVSFISLDKILPVAYKILDPDATMVALIKPQFEAGREQVGKKGVVRDPKVHVEVVERIVSVAKECGFVILGLDYSPIRGPEGNIEYLLWIGKPECGVKVADVDASATVSIAHESFGA